MDPVFSHTTCHIHLDAISRNFKRLDDPARLLPVIKSDAYGHGLLEVADTLSAAGAVRFAVGTVSEGLALRKQGFRQEILPLLGCVTESELKQAIDARLLPLAGSFKDLQLLTQIAGRQPVAIALKFDTGMGRLGFSSQELPALLDFLSLNPGIQPSLILSHLACADMPEESSFTTQQIEEFARIAHKLKLLYPDILASLGNSATAGSNLFDLIRPGIFLYGGNPLSPTGKTGDLPEWAMELEAPVLQIRDLPAGAFVSYGKLYQARKPLRAAVVSCGYANGIPRSLSNRLTVLVRGRRATQIGRICMGMFMIDVTDIPDAQAGDSVWILGGPASPGTKPQTPLELADLSSTIPYEILCLLGSLNPRRHHF